MSKSRRVEMHCFAWNSGSLLLSDKERIGILCFVSKSGRFGIHCIVCQSAPWFAMMCYLSVKRGIDCFVSMFDPQASKPFRELVSTPLPIGICDVLSTCINQFLSQNEERKKTKQILQGDIRFPKTLWSSNLFPFSLTVFASGLTDWPSRAKYENMSKCAKIWVRQYQYHHISSF